MLKIYTIIKTTSAVTQVVGGGRGRLAGDTDGLAGVRRWAVEVRVFTHAHVSMIAYRVDVYRSRLMGASLLYLALKGLHTRAGLAW